MKRKSKDLSKKYKILLTLTVNLLSFSLFSFEVTHQVRPDSSFETSALSGSCSTINESSFSTRCNPALFPYANKNGIGFFLIGKSDGDSLKNGQDLIFDPITESLIRRIFEERNFNSFTFNSDIVFKTSLFEISYSPYYLLADIFIFNPAFPEVSIHLVSRETLKISRGWELKEFKIGGHHFKTSFGVNLFYYKHLYENTVFSLFDLSFKKPEDLIRFKTISGISGDFGFFLGNNSLLIPNVSFQIKNIESKLKENKKFVESAFQQSPLFLFEPYSLIGIGKKIITKYGSFFLNLEVPFNGYFDQLNISHSLIGGEYSLNFFSLYIGAGQNYKNIGMRFNSKTFNVGITYSIEKDMGSLQSEFEKTAYTGIEISL